MAGIFADVSTDIQKLRQLKAEIDNVKKALKSIDINVNIDIAKGMENQLQSLMKQYDALAKKISEAEGKIMISTKRINDASEKIIKAQEQLSKATSMNSKDGIGTAGEMADKTDTGSVKAQAKAYEELKSEIDAVLGTRAVNIRRLIEEQNAIKLIQKEIKQLTRYQADNSTLSETQQKRLEQLNSSLLTHKTALSEIRQTLTNNAKLDNVTSTSMNGLSQSLSRMRIAYRELTEEERNSHFGKELLASINQADAKIKELDATIGNHQRYVGNYASGFNGLNMSVQQIVRELPSATMGLNMFFLAISNNLPILTDEIKRAKAANEELKASGEKGVPVWKQLASSLVSWQSAMMVGITLLSVYGKEITGWIGNLFKAGDAALSMEEAMENVNEALEKSNGSYGNNILSVKKLASEWKNLSSRKDQLQWIRDNKSEFDKLGISIDGVKDAENAFVKNTASIIEALKLRARAAAAEKLASEQYEKALLKRNEAETEKYEVKKVKGKNGGTEIVRSSKAPSFTDVLLAGMATGGSGRAGDIPTQTVTEAAERFKKQRIKDLEDAATKAEEAGDAYYDLVAMYEEKANSELDKAGIDKPHKKIKDNTNKITDQQSRLSELEKKQAIERAKEAVDLENQVEQARIDAMIEGGDKIIAQHEFENKKELQAIDKAKEEYIQKEIQRQKEIFEATEELKAKKNSNYKKKSFDSSSVTVDTSSFDMLKEYTFNKQLREELNAQKEAMNAYLAEYGTYMQKRQAIIKQYQDKINKASTEGEKLTLGKQRDKILSDLDEQANKTTSAISQLFGDMKDKTLKDLEAINTAGQKALEFLKSGQWDEQKGKDFGITKENFEIWSNDPEKIKAITDALLNNKKVAEELRPTYDKIADGLKRIFNSGNDTKKLDEALNDLRNGLSEILQVGSFLSDTFSSLGESFGANAFSGIAEGINVAMDSLNSAMQGAEAGSIFGPVGSAVGATVGFVSSISSAFAKIHDKKNEKQIQKLQKQIDVLTESYDKMGESVEKAYSKDASELIGQQNEMLEQQKVLIEQQIKEEKDKKDTDKKRIEEWENQIDEINDAIKDNKEKAVDAIFGEDLKTAIENFSSAYADAWSNGEDRAESAKETVKSMMRQMVTESIKSAIQVSGSMEKIRQKLQEFYADNVLSGWEQDYIYNMAEEIQKDLDKQFGWADNLFEEDSSKQQSASSRGFETMSQDTADELNGRFTAVYESNLRIETAEQQQTVAITQLTGSISALTSQASGMYNIADETRTILANSYLELQQIRENTGEIVKPIKQIQADIAEVKRNTSRL